MIYTKKIQRAIQCAVDAHKTQVRKVVHVPYISHPLAVALILSRAGADEDVVVAGILHDTIEDSEVTKEDIEKEFGTNITELVLAVTEKNKSLPWERRKADALAMIPNMSRGALLVKSADVLHNVSDLVESHATNGDTIFESFNAPKAEIIAHYTNAAHALEHAWSENPLVPELIESIERLATL